MIKVATVVHRIRLVVQNPGLGLLVAAAVVAAQQRRLVSGRMIVQKCVAKRYRRRRMGFARRVRQRIVSRR